MRTAVQMNTNIFCCCFMLKLSDRKKKRFAGIFADRITKIIVLCQEKF